MLYFAEFTASISAKSLLTEEPWTWAPISVHFVVTYKFYLFFFQSWQHDIKKLKEKEIRHIAELSSAQKEISKLREIQTIQNTGYIEALSSV